MAFLVSEEAVAVMKKLSSQINNAVDELHQANNEVITCYEQVKGSIGPYTKQIESIVRNLEKLIKKDAEDIEKVSIGLLQLSNRCQMILDKKGFKESLKVAITEKPNSSSNTKPSSGDPVKGQRIRQQGNQTEYEL